MFKKKESSSASFIGTKCCFSGEIKSKGTFRIDGDFDGNIDTDRIIVGRNGQLKGDIKVRGIIIDGEVEGEVTAEEIIEITPHGVIEGDIVTPKITISEGGVFKGSSKMLQHKDSEAPVVE